MSSRGELVRRVQQRLTIHNYSLGTIDGDFGPKTFAAVKQFQVNQNLQADGVIGQQTWIKLSGLNPYNSPC